jgi:hypothetical protein
MASVFSVIENAKVVAAIEGVLKICYTSATPESRSRVFDRKSYSCAGETTHVHPYRMQSSETSDYHRTPTLLFRRSGSTDSHCFCYQLPKLALDRNRNLATRLNPLSTAKCTYFTVRIIVVVGVMFHFQSVLASIPLIICETSRSRYVAYLKTRNA